MAKIGLDYFPHSTLHTDDLRYIDSFHEHGYKVYFKLLEKIYGQYGYYIPWGKKPSIVFANEINVNISDVNVIINELQSEKMLSLPQYNVNKILTSVGIQERFFFGISRRKEVELVRDYILIKNVNIVLKNVNIVWKNDSRNQQSKVKESKVNNKHYGWRKNFLVYLMKVVVAYQKILADKSLIDEFKSDYPSVDVAKSFQRSVTRYWGTEDGWNKKKKSQSSEINMKQTLIRNFERNIVLKNNGGDQPPSMEIITPIKDL